MVKVFSLSLACRLSVNLSVGLIDVASSSDYDPLYCSWTIGKVGITNAVALFIVQRINLGSCRYFATIRFIRVVVENMEGTSYRSSMYSNVFTFLREVH